MATIANLAVGLNAKTSRFNRKMRGSQKVVARFGGLVSSVGRKLAAFGGIAGGVGLTAFVKSSLSSIDATGKLAARLNVTTEQLIRLRHAAELTGAGSALLDKSLDVMSKRLGEVQLALQRKVTSYTSPHSGHVEALSS